MLKILQARLQQYVNRELPDVQAGFRKGRGTRDQIASVLWMIERVREFQKKKNLLMFYWLCQSFDCVSHNKLENSERDGNTRLLGSSPGGSRKFEGGDGVGIFGNNLFNYR